MCYSDFVIDSGRNFYYLKQCYPVETFFNISEDIEKLALATYLGQLTAEVVPDTIEDESPLPMLLNTFYVLATTKKNLKQIKSVYELRLMAEQGFSPSILGCEICGEKNFPMYFDIKMGRIYCGICKKGDIEVSESLLNALYYIFYCDKKKLFSFETSIQVVERLYILAEKYVLFHTGKTFKTLDYLNIFLKVP